jgi:hypothetical protein
MALRKKVTCGSLSPRADVEFGREDEQLNIDTLVSVPSN